MVGVLALAAALTPTMTPLWRSGLVVSGGFSLWLAWHSSNALDDGESTFLWTVALPLAIVGSAVWGAWTNRSTGATSTRPGWVGEGALPPMLELAFVAPPTAGARSRTCLGALDNPLPGRRRRRGGPGDRRARELVPNLRRRGRCDRPRGRRGRAEDRRHLHLPGARDEPAAAPSCGWAGWTRWTKSRWYFDFLIPISPAKVEGFRMYKLYLRTVASEIARLDPSTRARIGKAST